MTPLERLLAESIPTGTFGDAEPARRPVAPPPSPATATPSPDPDAAAHVARLLAALAEKPLRIGRRARPRRHLHAVPPAA
jgi:hypothetical protein